MDKLRLKKYENIKKRINKNNEKIKNLKIKQNGKKL